MAFRMRRRAVGESRKKGSGAFEKNQRSWPWCKKRHEGDRCRKEPFRGTLRSREETISGTGSEMEGSGGSRGTEGGESAGRSGGGEGEVGGMEGGKKEEKAEWARRNSW